MTHDKADNLLKRAAQKKHQERAPNFRSGDRLYLVRCFVCDPTRGRENWAMNVASGICAWCGWKDHPEKESEQ